MGEGEESVIKVTYETIFELLRREKNRDELQKLSSSFYSDIVGYLKEKENDLNPQISEIEQDKARNQFINTKKMIKELFERREKKIIILALNKARTPQSIIEYGPMLESEKKFFKDLVELFSKHRSEVLENVINKRYQSSANMVAPDETEPSLEKEKNDSAENKVLKKLEFIAPVPKFLGKEMETYGPFNPGSIAEIPTDIAKVLVTKGRAKEIRAG